MPSEKKEQAKQKIGTATGIWFYAKEITPVYETLKSRGVEITFPEKQPWVVIVSRFYDQDRNEYSLLEILNYSISSICIHFHLQNGI